MFIAAVTNGVQRLSILTLEQVSFRNFINHEVKASGNDMCLPKMVNDAKREVNIEARPCFHCSVCRTLCAKIPTN